MEALYAWDIEKHGDLLEANEAMFIRSSLPAYEATWASFIGHDGNGEAANLLVDGGITLPRDSEIWKRRKSFSQYHYTILESISSMRRVVKRLEDSFGRTMSHDSIQSSLDDVMLFHAQMGRARDSFAIASLLVDKPIPDTELEAYWDPRIVVIHGVRSPLRVDENGELMMVTPSRTSPEDHSVEQNWTLTSTWDEPQLTPLSFVNLREYLARQLDGFVQKTQGLLYRLNSGVHELMEKNRLTLAQPKMERYQGIGTNDSGFSGFRGQSGVQGSNLHFGSSDETNPLSGALDYGSFAGRSMS